MRAKSWHGVFPLACLVGHGFCPTPSYLSWPLCHSTCPWTCLICQGGCLPPIVLESVPLTVLYVRGRLIRHGIMLLAVSFVTAGAPQPNCHGRCLFFTAGAPRLIGHGRCLQPICHGRCLQPMFLSRRPAACLSWQVPCSLFVIAGALIVVYWGRLSRCATRLVDIYLWQVSVVGDIIGGFVVFVQSCANHTFVATVAW
jgi:hypothetical protein